MKRNNSPYTKSATKSTASDSDTGGGQSSVQEITMENGDKSGDLDTQHTPDIELHKTFDQLVKFGPSNESEQQLLSQAREYLSAAKFEELIQKKAAIPQVVAEIAVALVQHLQKFHDSALRNESQKRDKELEDRRNTENREKDISVSKDGILGALFKSAPDMPTIGEVDEKDKNNITSLQSSSPEHSFALGRNKHEEEKQMVVVDEEKSTNRGNDFMCSVANLGGVSAVVGMLFELLQNFNNEKYKYPPELDNVIAKTPPGYGVLSELCSSLRLLTNEKQAKQNKADELQSIDLRSIKDKSSYIGRGR